MRRSFPTLDLRSLRGYQKTCVLVQDQERCGEVRQDLPQMPSQQALLPSDFGTSSTHGYA